MEIVNYANAEIYKTSAENLQFPKRSGNWFDNPPHFGYNMTEGNRLPRAMWPKGIGVRKVRASQGRITDNDRRRRLQGKCNRNRPPSFDGKDGKAR